uniref:Uncharacterized protein n=1 Tax=Triticum urartu TaxID=4572 RepID=A0A8R7UW07_TRIUA
GRRGARHPSTAPSIQPPLHHPLNLHHPPLPALHHHLESSRHPSPSPAPPLHTIHHHIQCHQTILHSSYCYPLLPHLGCFSHEPELLLHLQTACCASAEAFSEPPCCFSLLHAPADVSSFSNHPLLNLSPAPSACCCFSSYPTSQFLMLLLILS